VGHSWVEAVTVTHYEVIKEAISHHGGHSMFDN
jgi:hypothetical protein